MTRNHFLMALVLATIFSKQKEISPHSHGTEFSVSLINP
jgi:hypothetical protein